MIRTTGVYATYPKGNANFHYKTTVDLGDIPVKEFLEAEAGKKSQPGGKPKVITSRSLNYHGDIMPVIEELKDKYRAYTYHMLTNNCNHFSNELV